MFVLSTLQRNRHFTLVSCSLVLLSLVLPCPSANGEPLTGLGDLNCDGVLNYADIDPFVLALSGQAAYEVVYPDCIWLAADCNRDGTVTYADIDSFVALLCGPIGACCTGADPDPGYAPFECLGDLTEADCYASGEDTNWTAGQSCDDPLFLCPGTPAYCDASGACDEYISRVVCGSIDNETGCTRYGNYTDLSAVAILRIPLDLRVWNGSFQPGDETMVWIDWNQDLDWQDEGEFIGTVVNQGVADFTLAAPPAALLGSTRMRIRIDYYPPTPYDPCGESDGGEVEDYTLIVSDDVPAGACCDPHTGLCTDNVEVPDCAPPLEFHLNLPCDALSPRCGNPGACCDEASATCTEAIEVACAARFVAGAACDPDPFDPPCGLWTPTGMLYAPSGNDTPSFRAAVSELLGGAPVDYFNAQMGTPTLEQLIPYACVFTWVKFSYADPEAMGDVLAQYVDFGGRVLLGQSTQPTGPHCLAGAIMEIGGHYLPATARHVDYGCYLGDGYGCAFTGVEQLWPVLHDVCTLTQIGIPVGSWQDGDPCVARRADSRVWTTPGNTAGTSGTGDWAQLTANLCTCTMGDVFGACCDLETGTCEDNVNALDCVGYPLHWTYGTLCTDLNPPCGTPGACCDDYSGVCTEEYEVNCADRFKPGTPCDPDLFYPRCGDARPRAVLYAPTQPDNPDFRATVSELMDGVPVDYFDARAGTPTLDQLAHYACVVTWVNYAYADNVAMGDVLAQFVDQRGRVLLGQWTQPTATNHLAGAIMEIDGPYLPATATMRGSGTYAGDGYGSQFWRVNTLVARYRDNCAVTAIGFAIGTWTDGYLCIAGTGNWRVWASPGNTGLDYGTGDWAQLTANLCKQGEPGIQGACCNVVTGECQDYVDSTDCMAYPLRWTYETLCDHLDPPCTPSAP